jgi:hypothetical protein
MRVSVSPDRLEVTAGAPHPVAITISNPGSVIGGYAVRILGADPAWVELEDDRISLFPDESRTITATITVPPGLVAGERRMAVQVRELTPPESSAVEEIVLVVPEAASTMARVDPVTQTTGRTGRFSLLLDNNGNTPARGWLAGDDGEGRLRYRFEPPTVDLAPGEHAVVDLRVRGRRPVIGQPAIRMINVHVVDGPEPPTANARRSRDAAPPPDPEAPPAATASLVQNAMLSRGPIGLFGLLAAITVFALVITIALSRLVGQSAADRNLALEIAANQDSSSASGNSGVTGTVRLLTTGRPVEGVAVNVFAADDLIRPVVSVATADKGGYRVEGLPAGDYKLVFRGSGFEPLWYPRSLDPENAETVTVEENNQVAGLDVALGGAPATISGTVVGEDVSGATVALRTPSSTVPVSGGVIGTADPLDDGALVQTTPVGTDGSFAFADVPSPSVYDIVVTKTGFAKSSQRVDVAAGEERDGVEVNLVRGNGIISGQVVADGKPLEEVTLTVTAGQTSASTVSLTGSDAGSFTLRRLPTPATYTLVASKDNYATQTLSLTLGEGQALTGVWVSLGASSGSLSGQVSLDGNDPASGVILPAGGVTVTVTDGIQTIQTATQSTGSQQSTSAGPGDGIGSWKVSGLQVPGTYTVTFSRADLAPQTVSVSLGDDGRITKSSIGVSVGATRIETALRSATAVLEGRVTQPLTRGSAAVPVGEVTVHLSSGASSYTVTTASVPQGERGRYRIENLPPGTYTISLSRRGVRPTSGIRELTAGTTAKYSQELPLAASVGGTVVRRGTNVSVGAGYVVELFRASEYPAIAYSTTTTVGSAGAFSFDDVDAPEVYVVQVRRTRGSAPIGSSTVTVGPSDQKNDIVVKVDP